MQFGASRRASQPQGAARIDWSNPITRGIVSAFLPVEPTVIDPAIGSVWLFAAGGVTQQSPLGGSVGHSVSASGGSVHRLSSPISGSSFEATFFSVQAAQNPALGSAVVSLGSSSSIQPNAILGVGSANSSVVRLSVRDNAQVQILDITGTKTAYETGVKHAICGVVRSFAGGFCEIYVDGVLDTSGACSGGVVAVDRIAFGALSRPTVVAPYTGGIHVGGVWNRALSAQEIASLSANPWQLFAPQPSRLSTLASVPLKTYAPFRLARGATRAQQPQGPVVIDRSNPITRGLIDAVLPASRASVVNSTNRVLNGTFPSLFETVGSLGRGVSDLTAGYISYSAPWHAAPPPFTAMVLWQCRETGTLRRIAGDSFSNGGWQFSISATNQQRVFGQNASSITTIAAGSTVSVGSVYCDFAEFPDTNTVTLFQNGVQTASATAASLYSPSLTDLMIGHAGVSDTFWLGAHRVYMVVQFARVLTQAEKLALVANPWQLFAPAPRTLAVDFATVQARTFAPLKLRGAPRAAQAQQPARVNWGHPLAQGLRAVQSGPVVELVNGIAYRLPQSVVTPTREGVAFAYPNNTSPAGVSPAYPGDDGTRCTLELLHRWTSVDTGDREFMSFGANSGQQVRGIFARGASRTIVLGNFNADIDSGIPFAQDGSLQHIFITFGSAAPSLFYVNGRLAFTGASSAVLASALQTFAVPGARGIFPAPDAKIIKSAYYNRVLSASEISALTANPWQVYSSSQLTLGVEFAGTITRPASDIVVAGWTATPGPSFYSAIDDATADDTDFVTSPDVNAATPLVNGLSQTVPAGRYDIRIRARRTAAAGQIRIVLLDSSNSPVGTSAWQALTASFAPYTLSITTTGTADRVRHEVQP